MNVYLLGSAIVPSILLVWFFQRRDLYPEPARVLWATFLLGVFTVVPVLLLVPAYSRPVESIADPVVMSLAKAFLLAAIPEEFFKYLVVVGYCARHMEFDEPMDGIVYGVVASLGFATLENILYVSDGGFGLALLRALTAVPGHALTGAIMGYFVGQAKFGGGSSARNWAMAFAAPTMLHGLYDFPLMAASASTAANGGEVTPWAGLLLVVLAVLIFEWVFAVKKMRHLRREQDAAHPERRPSESLRIPTKEVLVSLAHPTSMGIRIVGVLFLILGGLLATGGGLVLVGFGISIADRGFDGDIAATTVGLALFAALPLLLGFLLFRSGLRRMNA